MKYQTIKINVIKTIVKRNPRYITAKELKELTTSSKFMALVESVSQLGVLVPLHVEDLGDGTFGIIAGERRWRAAGHAKAKEVPCIVYDKDDPQIALVTATENLHREPLSVAGMLRVIDQLGNKSIESVQGVLGVTLRMAQLLMRLKKHLIKEIYQDLLTEEPYFTLVQAALLTRYNAPVQHSVWANPHNYARSKSMAAGEKCLAEYCRDLSIAKWDTSVAHEVAVNDTTREVACDKCQFTSKKNAKLFDDGLPVICEDMDCWNAHRIHTISTDLALAMQKYDKLIVVSTDYANNDMADTIAKTFGLKYFKSHDSGLTKVKKNRKNARPAFVLTKKDGYRIAYYALGKIAAASANDAFAEKTKDKTYEQKYAILEKKRWRAVNNQVAKLIPAVPRKEVFGNNDNELDDSYMFEFLTYLSIFGCASKLLYEEFGYGCYAQFHEAVIELSHPEEIAPIKYNDMWDHIRINASEMLKYDGTIIDAPALLSEYTTECASLFCINAIEIYNRIKTEKGFTVPKSWGTPGPSLMENKTTKRRKTAEKK